MRLARPVNPVFARELRQRMRGPRAAVILTAYLLFLVLVVQLLYAAASGSDLDGPGVENTAALGRTIFQTLLFFVLALVCFIVPGVTAGAIAGERARQTLVPLQITLLRPRAILVGKLMASLAFVALLIVATLPVAGVSFLLGGVEPLEVVRATAMVLVVAVVLGSLSLLCSTFLRGSQGATVVALALTFVLCVGTFMAYGVQRLFNERRDEPTSQVLLVVNPFMAVADVLDRGDDVAGDEFDASPFTPMKYLLRERGQVRGDEFGGEQGAGFAPAPGAGPLVAEAVPAEDGGVHIIAGEDEEVRRRLLERKLDELQAGEPDVIAADDPEAGPRLQAEIDRRLARARAAEAAQVLEDRRARIPLADRPPFWLESLLAYALLVAGSLALAARRLALPRSDP